MRQAGEFSAAAGWRGTQAGAIPFCPGEFGFKSGSPGVQTLAKSRGYYFPFMKGPTCFVILLLFSCLSLLHLNGRAGLTSPWYSLFTWSPPCSQKVAEGNLFFFLSLMPRAVTLCGRSVWLWLKSTGISHGRGANCYTCRGVAMVRFPTEDLRR